MDGAIVGLIIVVMFALILTWPSVLAYRGRYRGWSDVCATPWRANGIVQSGSQRHENVSYATRHIVRNRRLHLVAHISPGASQRSPSPDRSVFGGAVIGSIATAVVSPSSPGKSSVT